MSWLWGRDELDELAEKREAMRTIHYRYCAVIAGGDQQTQALFVGSSLESHEEALGAAVLAMKRAQPKWLAGAHVLFTVNASDVVEPVPTDNSETQS